MIWIACSISRSRVTSAMPPLGLTSGGNAQPAPTKSYRVTSLLIVPLSVELELRALDLDHAGAALDRHAAGTALESQLPGSPRLDVDVAGRLQGQRPVG